MFSDLSPLSCGCAIRFTIDITSAVQVSDGRPLQAILGCPIPLNIYIPPFPFLSVLVLQRVTIQLILKKDYLLYIMLMSSALGHEKLVSI